MKARIHGLYAVTPDEPDDAVLGAKVSQAILGGAKFVQYRNKAASAAQRTRQAALLRDICAARGASLIVNDHLGLAVEVDADGLHLGKEDGAVAAARAVLGPEKILGISCYNVFRTAIEAQQQGADYVAFGSFFPSTVKPGAVRATVGLLQQAERALSVPVVAIGGITLDNAPDIVAAGADSVAVISALFDAPDVRLAAEQFRLLFGPDR
jgi:thiamine-phosphate pyrophosphorylase